MKNTLNYAIAHEWAIAMLYINIIVMSKGKTEPRAHKQHYEFLQFLKILQQHEPPNGKGGGSVTKNKCYCSNTIEKHSTNDVKNSKRA
jgi:hypothetical protein